MQSKGPKTQKSVPFLVESMASRATTSTGQCFFLLRVSGLTHFLGGQIQIFQYLKNVQTHTHMHVLLKIFKILGAIMPLPVQSDFQNCGQISTYFSQNFLVCRCALILSDFLNGLDFGETEHFHFQLVLHLCFFQDRKISSSMRSNGSCPYIYLVTTQSHISHIKPCIALRCYCVLGVQNLLVFIILQNLSFCQFISCSSSITSSSLLPNLGFDVY